MEDIWMKRIKFTIKSVLVILVVLLVTAIGATYWAAKNPRQAFSLVEKYVLPEDLSIKWEAMEFQAKRASLRHWDIDWSVNKLFVEKLNPQLAVPVNQAALRFTLRIFEEGPWFSFREIKALVGENASFKASPEAATDTVKQSPYEQFQSYLGYIRTAADWLTVDVLEVQVPKFTLLGPATEGDAILSAKFFKPSKDKESGATGVELTYVAGTIKFVGEGWVDANKLENSTAPFLGLTANLNGPKWQTNIQMNGTMQGENANFVGKADSSYGDLGKTIKAQPQFNLLFSAAEAHFKLETAVNDIPGPLAKIDKLEAEIHVPFDKGYAWSERPATFKIWSAVDLFFIDKDMRPPLEKSCRCKIPEKLVVTYDGRIWLGLMLGQADKPVTVIESKLSVEGVDNKLLNVNLNAHLKVNKSKEQWILEPRMDSQITIQSFQGLRQFLDARNVLIPAPLDILDGTITLTARGAVDHDDKLIRAAVDVKTNLTSATQTVSLESTTRLDLARNFKSLDVFVQLLIKEVKIELPPIDPIRGIPSLKTDSRMVFKAPKSSVPSDFKLRVFFDVKTASSGSVKLLSKLANPYAPLTLDINNNNKGESSGSIRLEPFSLVYLRRTVIVERLQMTLSEDENGDFPIGGRLRLDQTAYKIYVDLAGTLDSPIVNLNSEPFLPRADIISVLLFNRVNDQLVSADADTAGSFEAALADRAIGLLGLWAFATTPIRSFSYNAVTKVYTATIQLADGLTAGVGTNWERAAHLEVRKRVSRRWVLTASWSPTDDREQVGKLVLQWEKRF